jgi:hypothetical protein
MILFCSQSQKRKSRTKVQTKRNRLISMLSIPIWLVATNLLPQEIGARPDPETPVSDQGNWNDGIKLVASGENPLVCMSVWHRSWTGDTGFLCFSRDRVRYDVKVPLDGTNLGFDHPRTDLITVEKWANAWGAKLRFRDGRNWHFLRVRESRIRHGTAGDVSKSEALDSAPLFEAANHFDQLVSELQKRSNPSPGDPRISTPISTLAAESATLTVLTHLANVRVYLDSQFKGATGSEGRLVISQVSTGSHQLKLVSNGRDILTKDFSTSDGDTPTIDFKEDSGLKPLTEAEIEELFVSGVPRVRIMALITQYGVAFGMTEEIERKLRSVGVDDGTLLAIAKAKK